MLLGTRGWESRSPRYSKGVPRGGLLGSALVHCGSMTFAPMPSDLRDRVSRWPRDCDLPVVGFAGTRARDRSQAARGRRPCDGGRRPRKGGRHDGAGTASDGKPRGTALEEHRPLATDRTSARGRQQASRRTAQVHAIGDDGTSRGGLGARGRPRSAERGGLADSRLRPTSSGAERGRCAGGTGVGQAREYTSDRWAALAEMLARSSAGARPQAKAEMRVLARVHDSLKNRVKERWPKTGENHTRREAGASRRTSRTSAVATIELTTPHDIWPKTRRPATLRHHCELLESIPTSTYSSASWSGSLNRGQEPRADPMVKAAGGARLSTRPAQRTAAQKVRTARGSADGGWRFSFPSKQSAKPASGNASGDDPCCRRPLNARQSCSAPRGAPAHEARAAASVGRRRSPEPRGEGPRRPSSAAGPRGSRPASNRSAHPRRCGGPQRAVRERLRLPTAVPGLEHRRGRSGRRVWPPRPGGTRPGWRTRRRGRARCRFAL